MADSTDILIDNLKETFRAIEKFLIFGVTSSLVLIVLAVTNRELSGEQKLPMFADMSAPSVLVAFVALGTWVASGAFAAFCFAARNRIVSRLRELAPELVGALLTYPSIAARIGAPQIVALACVGAMGAVALLIFYVPTHETQKALAAAALLGSPYIVLVALACSTAFKERTTR